jgi:hypothetical protein
MNSLNCRLLAVLLLSWLWAPVGAHEQQMQMQQPQRNYFYNNVPPATGAGYTGYGGQPAYYGDYNYRYQPMNSYYTQRPPWQNYNPTPYAVRPRYAYAPAGLVISATLQTPISTQVAGQGRRGPGQYRSKCAAARARIYPGRRRANRSSD